MRALLTKLEHATRLDMVGDRLQQTVQSIIRSQRARDLLHGVWLGHPLHPAMVELPIGAWMSAAIFDLVPGQRRAATGLIAIGTVSALPTAITGLNDWASLGREQRRVGLVHALANTVGVTLYASSLVSRLRGRHGTGRGLAYLGLAAATGGAYLGGHMAYKQAAATNQSAPDVRHISDGWHRVIDFASLPQAELTTCAIDDVAVLLYRDGDDITVMLERCAHQGGPLGAGKVTHIDGHACVVCPWHGSTFRLTDGTVEHGPAANDEQILQSRVVDGVVEARLP